MTNIMKNFLIILILLNSNNAYSASKNKETYEYLDLFGQIFDRVRSEYVEEVTDQELIEKAIDGMLTGLDPHSGYMNEEVWQEMQMDTQGKFGGLGIEIGMEAGVVKVISPIADTPAEKAGIKAGDYIVRINNEQVQGKTLMEAVKLMRGPVGSSIELTVRRKDVKKSLTFFFSSIIGIIPIKVL